MKNNKGVRTMWNSKRVKEYDGMIAETVGITGHDGKPIRAYYSRPLGIESFPGIVLGDSPPLHSPRLCRGVPQHL